MVMPVEGPARPGASVSFHQLPLDPLTPSKRISVSLERASRGALSYVPDSTRHALVEALQCLICLDVLQLPVSIICFPNCPGTHARANNTCLRGSLCQHCANEALQLDRPPAERFPEEGGKVRCMICRVTAADARLLSPVRAYVLNHVLMDVMDSVDVGASCRKCEKEFESQAELQAHYLQACPHAVVQCRFKGCAQVGVRTRLQRHQDTCSLGRAVCQQCQEWVDKDELVYHMVTQCRMRVVVCILCNHRACLPDMLLHLRLHQAQLQLKMMRKVPAASPSHDAQRQQQQQQRSTMSQAVAATLRADLNLISDLNSTLHSRAAVAGAAAGGGGGRGYATYGGATAATAAATAAAAVAASRPSVTAAVASTIGPLSPRRPATPQSRSYPAAAGADRGAAAMAALLLAPPTPIPPAHPHADGSRTATPVVSALLGSISPSSGGALSYPSGWQVYDMAPSSGSSSSSSSSSGGSRPSSSSGTSAELSSSAGPSRSSNESNAVSNSSSSGGGGGAVPAVGPSAAPGPGALRGPLAPSGSGAPVRPGSALTLVSTSILPANQHQMLFEMLQRLRAYKQQQRGEQGVAQAAAAAAGELHTAASASAQEQQQQTGSLPPADAPASAPPSRVLSPHVDASAATAAAAPAAARHQPGCGSGDSDSDGNDGRGDGGSAPPRLRSLPVVLIDRSYFRGQSSGCREHAPRSPLSAFECGSAAACSGEEEGEVREEQAGGERRSGSGEALMLRLGSVAAEAEGLMQASTAPGVSDAACSAGSGSPDDDAALQPPHGSRRRSPAAAAAAAAAPLAPHPFQLQRRAAQSLDLPRRRRLSDSHALETSRYELAAAAQAVALAWPPGGAM